MRTYIMCIFVGICFILMILSFITNFKTPKRKYSLFSLALSTIILLVADRLVYFFNGNTSIEAIYIARVSKFLGYGSFLLIIYCFNKYLSDLLVTDGQLKEVPRRLKAVDNVLIVGNIALALSQIFGTYYFFDENNIYHRAELNFVAYIFPLVALVIQITAILQFHSKLRKRLIIPLALFTVLPIAAAVMQYILHGVLFTSATIVGMVVLLYCFTIFDTNKLVEDSHKKEIELLLENQKNVKLMVTQTTMALVEAIDAKDSYTNGHSNRVADYSVMIAERAGKTQEEQEEIYLIALLHDVGKIGISNAIINKKGKLTDEEYAEIKRHPTVGREILSKISIDPKLAIGASFHHERYDGKGYPMGLKGEEIPEIARIIAVADSYDAMASKRSYRDVLPKEKIRSELVKGKGTQFDPVFAEIMINIIDEDKDYQLKEH